MHEKLRQAIKSDDLPIFCQEITNNNSALLKEALYYACKEGSLNIAKYLIEIKKVNPNIVIDSVMAMDNGPMFKFAAESGNLELVKYLLETCHIETIEARGEHGGTQDTALSRAAREGHADVVQYLLTKGANYNAKISYGTILSHGIDSRVIEVVEALVMAGTEIKSEDLHKAIETGQLAMVKYLMEHGADIHKSYLEPFIQVAVESGNVELVKFLEHNGISILDPNRYYAYKDQQYEMLSAAAESGNVDMMRYLVEMHKLDVIAYVKKENDDQYAYKYSAERTILGKAVRNSCFHTKTYDQVLLLQYLFDELHLTPPKEALKQLQMEKSSGIKISAYLESYLTASQNDKKLFLTIAEKGLDGVSISNLFQLYSTCLINKGDDGPGFMDLLRENNLLRNHIEQLNLTNEQLSELSKENQDFARDAVFYYAEYPFKNNFEKLKLFLSQGADINAMNAKGENLVRHAVISGGYNNIVKFLIANGADVDQPCHRGLTTINILGRQSENEKSAFETALKSAKDYTNTLKEACQTHDDRSLTYVLKHSKGEIGQANPKELLERALISGKITELLSYVSDPIFANMQKLLKDNQFIQQHNFSREQINKMLTEVQNKVRPRKALIVKDVNNNNLTTTELSVAPGQKRAMINNQPKASDYRDAAENHFSNFIVNKQKGELNQAEASLTQAIAACGKIANEDLIDDDNVFLAICYHQQGSTQYQQQQYEKAVSSFIDALESASKIPEERREDITNQLLIDSYFDLGKAYKKMWRLQVALDCTKESLHLREHVLNVKDGYAVAPFKTTLNLRALKEENAQLNRELEKNSTNDKGKTSHLKQLKNNNRFSFVSTFNVGKQIAKAEEIKGEEQKKYAP